ncbi:MAG TPA: hypothetical protein VIT67_09370 [Povalibacter sp.]
MDDYTFIVLAKLKADFQRLERERLAKSAGAAIEGAELPAHRSPKARRAEPSHPDLSALVSTHGLRGWS